MVKLRVESFEQPTTFLEAVKQYDNSFMNFCIGTLHDVVRRSTGLTDPNTVTLLAVFRGDDLVISLIKPSSTAPWLLCAPCSEEEMPTSEIVAAVMLLCDSLLSRADPLLLGRVVGPDNTSKAFLDAWVVAWNARGTHLHVVERGPPVRLSYANRQSLLPPSKASPNGTMTLATLDDLESLLPLHLEFANSSPLPAPNTRDDAIAYLRLAIWPGLVWLYYLGDALVGYLVLGRVSPKTIAIRNIYVSPEHRCRGIAECMVRAVTRHYLGVDPTGIEGVSPASSTGSKEEVNLNVIDPGAERIYRRVGFLFPERTGGIETGGRDPVTGRKASYTSAQRGVEVETSAAP